MEKYSHHNNGNWPVVYIHRRGEGGYKNEPCVLSSIHFVSEEDMVFLLLLTKNKHETLIQWVLERVVLTFSIEDVLCTLSNTARCV